MNNEERKKSLGIYKLVISIIGLGLVSVLVYQFIGEIFGGSKYWIQALLVTMLVYVIIVFVLLHRSLAEVFGKLIWGKVVYVQRGNLGPNDEAVKGLKMKVNVEGKVHTFRYTYSQFSDDAEGGSVGHYVAVYKFGPCMSVDVRRRRELEKI